MTRIKFCGLADEDEIQLASELGASYVGLVVQAPKSHRNLDLDTARALVDAAPVGVRTVVVTPTDDADALETAAGLEADILQVTGDPPAEAMRQVRTAHDVETWKAASLDADVDATLSRLAGLQTDHEAVVLDAVEDGYGGHGETIDWATAAAVVDQLEGYPVVLAGGLSSDNVAEAISRVSPWCVDVSSGIETDRAKDPDRMRAFAQAVRAQEVPS